MSQALSAELEGAGLLNAVFHAHLAAFGAQGPELATRYR